VLTSVPFEKMPRVWCVRAVVARLVEANGMTSHRVRYGPFGDEFGPAWESGRCLDTRRCRHRKARVDLPRGDVSVSERGRRLRVSGEVLGLCAVEYEFEDLLLDLEIGNRLP